MKILHAVKNKKGATFNQILLLILGLLVLIIVIVLALSLNNFIDPNIGQNILSKTEALLNQ